MSYQSFQNRSSYQYPPSQSPQLHPQLQPTPLQPPDFKQSTISQQTIINKANLSSPQKPQNILKYHPITKSNTKTIFNKQLSTNIHDIIHLCQNDKNVNKQQLQNVIQGQMGIANLMQSWNQQIKYQDNRSKSLHKRDLGRDTTFGPSRFPQFPHQKIHARQTQQRQPSNRNNIYKKSAIQYLKTDRNAQQSLFQPTSNPPPQIYPHPILQNIPLSTRTNHTFQSPQSKTLSQIHNLRKDKINLMKKLNEQIRAHNQQKKLRIQLENQLTILKTQGCKPQWNLLQYQPNQTLPLINSYTYYPSSPRPGSNNKQFNNVIKSQGTPFFEQNQSPEQQQIKRLQHQNAYLKQTIKPISQPFFASQKSQLKHQIILLTTKINKYQLQLQKLRKTLITNPELIKGKILLQQGQKIKNQTIRLLKNHDKQTTNTNLSQTFYKISNDNQQTIQGMQNFKNRLAQLQQQDQRLDRLNNLTKKNTSDQFTLSSYFPNNKISKNSITIKNNTQNYIKQFQQII